MFACTLKEQFHTAFLAPQGARPRKQGHGMGTWYTTREDVKRSLDINETARSNAQVDRAIEAASRAVEGYLHRVFVPTLATRTFDWPNGQHARSWRLWLDHDDLISVTTLSSGGTTIASTDYFLEPANEGPPYDSIEIDLDSTSAFSSSGTHQRAISVTGLWGWSNDTTTVGTIAEALDASETGVDVDGPTASQVGVGSVLTVDSERMLVTERGTLTTGQTLQSAMTNQNNNVTVSVTTGSAFAVGEVILLDSERMLIVDITSNDLTVKRAWDGSVIAAHTGSTVFAYRTLTVARGALGTTAATHSSGASVLRWDVPGPVRELAMAEAINNLEQAKAAYARTSGSGESEREMRVLGLESLRKSVRRSHGRKGRVAAV